MNEQLQLLPGRLAAHVELALTALLLGALVSLPLGVWVASRRRAQAVVLGVASMVQTIPSLALLAMMVPALAWLSHITEAKLGLQLGSIGYLPALLALFLYSVFPMLQAVVTGLTGVDPAQVQAAHGVGMTAWQRLLRVELVQAMPVIVAGVRTAAVWVVGMTVLSTPVGAPSLGNYIFSGLQMRDYTAVSVGCAAAAVLALALDLLIRAIEVGLRRRQRLRLGAALVVLAVLYGFVGVATARRLAPQARVLHIGAKSFTESYVLAEVLAAQLRSRTGHRVEIVPSLGSNLALEALQHGAIDAYVDYTGALWTTLMAQHPGEAPPRADMLPRLVATLQQQAGIAVVAQLGFENAYTLAMRRRDADSMGIASLEDLAQVRPLLRIAGDYEIFARDEYRRLKRAYGLEFAEERSMDPSLMLPALVDGRVDLVTAYTSDGRLQDANLVALRDPRQILPPYDALILAGATAQQDIAVMQALRSLDRAIPLARMQALNAKVDQAHQNPARVAADFVKALSANAPPARRPVHHAAAHSRLGR